MSDAHFGADLLIVDQDVAIGPSGDVQLVSGIACLVQDIAHRLITPRGDLFAHPDYGLDYLRFIQAEDTPTERLELEQEARREIERDPRVEPGSAEATVLDWDADTVRLQVSFRPLGRHTRVNLVLGLGADGSTVEEVETR